MTAERVLGSIVIPAHNEARVIARCVDALLDRLSPGEVEIVVVCNGCTDNTADVVRSRSSTVRVVEIAQASKPAALRAGEAACTTMPRLYLDADVVLSSSSARAVLERLAAGAPAARPPIRYDADRSTWLVRRYYRCRSRVPAVMESLWGAGVYGLSARGRARFGAFPDLVAEDLWVDQHFLHKEIEIVDCPPVVVAVPRTIGDLLNVLRRTYRGKRENYRASGEGDVPETAPATMRDLARLARTGPVAAFDVSAYIALVATARFAARAARDVRWERDDSSRAA